MKKENPRLRWLLLLLSVLTAMACSSVQTPQGGPRAPPSAVASVRAAHPTLLRIQGNLWVVGLPDHHGWARERRVLLTKRNAERGVDLKVGVVVVLDDTYATAAPVGIVYEEPGESLDGALASILGADQHLRLGRGFGALSAVVSTTLVEITLGRSDGVAVGDIYEVRGPNGVEVLGRVQVSELQDTRAKATVINAGLMAVGQEVVYQPKSEKEANKRESLKIVVCNFTPKAQDADVARAGQAFAFDLAKHLREAASQWQGLEVMQAPQMVLDHPQARALGKSYQADVVVWGTAMCFKDKGCALPTYTVVDPERLVNAERSGHEVRFDPLSPGSAIERGTARDPAGIVMGLLGALAYQAQHYRDAVFYLGKVPEGALKDEDYFSALQDLGYAQNFLGRVESAMDAAIKLRQAAHGKHQGWEAAGTGQQARILLRKGQVDEALKLFRETLAVFEVQRYKFSRAVALGEIARILTDKGQVDEALKLHRETLAVFEALGNKRSCGINIGDIARILTNKGEVDEALKLHREALAIYDALGDRYSRAIALGDVAHILRDKGQVDEALKLLRERLTIFEAVGDKRESAATLGDIAHILYDKGQVDEALKLHREALSVYEAIGDKLSRALAFSDIAHILVNKGQVDEALKLLRQALGVVEALRLVRPRAIILVYIARILVGKGQVDEAHKLLRDALTVIEALGDKRGRAVILGDIARILANKGQVDEALKIQREALTVYETLGDKGARAVTLGHIARILVDKGQVDEALKLHREKLAVIEVLGDKQERAIILGDIAHILMNKGQVDDALKLHRERLAVVEALGDKHSRASTLGQIAHILKDKGQLDEALKLLREALAIYEALGNKSSRAATLAGIARILTNKGQLDVALKLLREALTVAEVLGDKRARSITLFDIARISILRKDITEALPLLRESYEIALNLGDAIGIAFVGDAFAQTLVKMGAKKEAEAIVSKVVDALVKIGKPGRANALRVLISGKKP